MHSTQPRESRFCKKRRSEINSERGSSCGLDRGPHRNYETIRGMEPEGLCFHDAFRLPQKGISDCIKVGQLFQISVVICCAVGLLASSCGWVATDRGCVCALQSPLCLLVSVIRSHG